jgi:hypothetical protein
VFFWKERQNAVIFIRKIKKHSLENQKQKKANSDGAPTTVSNLNTTTLGTTLKNLFPWRKKATTKTKLLKNYPMPLRRRTCCSHQILDCPGILVQIFMPLVITEATSTTSIELCWKVLLLRSFQMFHQKYNIILSNLGFSFLFKSFAHPFPPSRDM